jgi:hypothetical protein
VFHTLCLQLDRMSNVSGRAAGAFLLPVGRGRWAEAGAAEAGAAAGNDAKFGVVVAAAADRTPAGTRKHRSRRMHSAKGARLHRNNTSRAGGKAVGWQLSLMQSV